MKLQNFQVELVDWSREDQRAALLDLRDTVFIQEQHVPEARERDGIDGDCQHVLARDDDGQPIGCGRLTPARKIGRMAVLAEWRGRGVGAAMLRELIARAGARGWTEVALAAQTSAIGFYERAGFEAHGDIFDDAGLPHRAMRLALPIDEDAAAPLPRVEALAASSRNEIGASRLQLLIDARHRLCLYLPTLGTNCYASSEELDEIRRVAISGRRAQIRILLHDSATALRHDHRLIALAQRLTTAIQVRTPLEEVDLAYASSYLLNDVGGYLFLPDVDKPQGRGARSDRPSQAPLQQHFDEV
ncbi:MAG: GNAT family N-acetyltransferase, partial [Pseudomonadota bacterium]|nr:GNAT family N-acetyltransferase [Pseudomonadota bacterium]